MDSACYCKCEGWGWISASAPNQDFPSQEYCHYYLQKVKCSLFSTRETEEFPYMSSKNRQGERGSRNTIASKQGKPCALELCLPEAELLEQEKHKQLHLYFSFQSSEKLSHRNGGAK